MKKKIFGLLLIFIVPVLLLTGCASMYTYIDKYSDKVFLVKIQGDNNEWIEYTDINKYILTADTGIVYLRRENGEVIITYLENVIIYCK